MIDNASATSRGRRAGLAGLALAALVAGGSVATAAPALATPDNKDWAMQPNISEFSAPAAPGCPDVGRPGEGAGTESLLTIDPYGNKVPSRTSEPAAAGRDQVHANGFKWTWVRGVVAGARIRTRPVNGAVIGLIPYNAEYLVGCKKRASDGYAVPWC